MLLQLEFAVSSRVARTCPLGGKNIKYSAHINGRLAHFLDRSGQRVGVAPTAQKYEIKHLIIHHLLECFEIFSPSFPRSSCFPKPTVGHLRVDCHQFESGQSKPSTHCTLRFFRNRMEPERGITTRTFFRRLVDEWKRER